MGTSDRPLKRRIPYEMSRLYENRIKNRLCKKIKYTEKVQKIKYAKDIFEYWIDNTKLRK